MKIKKVRGDKVEYYLDKDYSIVTGNGYLEAQARRCGRPYRCLV